MNPQHRNVRHTPESLVIVCYPPGDVEQTEDIMEGDTRNEIADPGETLAGLTHYLPDSDPAHGLWLALAAADWQRLALDDGDTSALLVQLLTHLAACPDCLSLMRYVRTLAAQGAFDTRDDAESGRALGRLLAELEAAATEDRVRDSVPLFTQVLVLDGETVARETYPEVAAHLEVCATCRLEVESQWDQLTAAMPPDDDYNAGEGDDLTQQRSERSAAADERFAPALCVSSGGYRVLSTWQTPRAGKVRVAASWLHGLGQPATGAGITQTPDQMAHHALSGSQPRPAILHLVQMDTLERSPISSLVIRGQTDTAPWWLDVPRSAWQIWVAACTTIDSRMYLDTLPLPCVVHDDDDSETREIVLLLPEPLRHASYQVAQLPGEAGKWAAKRVVPMVSWDKVLRSGALPLSASPSGRAGRPVPAEPSEPWHQALKSQMRQQLSRRGWKLPGAEPNQPDQADPSFFAPRHVRDSARSERLTGVASEDESDGLAHFALGTLYELAAQSGAHENVQTLQTAIAHYEHAQHYLSPSTYPLHDALVRRRLGRAYFQYPDRGHFQLAIDMYREAATTFERHGCVLDAALCHVNLGNLLAHSARGRHDTLDRAIGELHTALHVLKPQEQPVAWAAAQYNLGIVYRERGEPRGEVPSDRRMLEMAIGCLREALRIFTADRFRVQYGLIQHQIGLAYHLLDGLQPTDDSAKHITAYKEALHALNPEHFPTERAALNLQLGRAHFERPGGGELAARDAEPYLRAALNTFTKDTHPQQYHQATDLLSQVERRIQGKQ